MINQELTILKERQSFLKYMLEHYEIDNKHTVWLLNIMKDFDEITTKLIFMNAKQEDDKELVVFENFRMHLNIRDRVYTDSDVIFHYIRTMEHDLYVRLLFYDMKYDKLYIYEMLYKMLNHHDALRTLDEQAVKDIKGRISKIKEYHPGFMKDLVHYTDSCIDEALTFKNEELFRHFSLLKSWMS